MDTILVEIYLPAGSKAYDVYVPFKSRLHEVISLLSGILTELSGGYYTAAHDAVICDKETGAVLDINKTIEELKLHNGSRLMLI